MVHLFKCGNFHSKPEMPFHQGLSLPPKSVLSVNQGWEVYEVSTGYRIAQTYSGDGTCQQVIEMASTRLRSFGKQGFSKRLVEAREILQKHGRVLQKPLEDKKLLGKGFV